MRPITALATAGGGLHVLGLGNTPVSDSHAMHRHFDGNQWAPSWLDGGGVFASTLAVASRDGKLVDVFGLGTEFSMFHRAWNGLIWTTDWERLEGNFSSPPTVVSAAPGTLDVFALGADHSLYRRHFDGRSWSPNWDTWGGHFTSAPTAVVSGPGCIDVFGLDCNFAMLHRRVTPGGWSPQWEPLGGIFTSPPSAVAWRKAVAGANPAGAPGCVSVFGLGTDSTLWCKTWDGRAWSAEWLAIGGPFKGPVAVASCAPGTMDVLAVNTVGAMQHRRFQGFWGTPWQNLGGQFSAAPALVSTGFGELDVFGLGLSQDAFHKAFRQGTWRNDWQPLGGSVLLPGRYRFSLDSLDIDETRSLFDDTVHVAVSLTVGGRPIQTLTKHLGNQGKGHQVLNLSFEPVTVDLGEFVLFNYTVLNQGHDQPSTVAFGLLNALKVLAEKGVAAAKAGIAAGLTPLGAAALNGVILPVLGPILNLAESWLKSHITDIVFVNCDGPVAVEQAVLGGAQLRRATLAGHAAVFRVHHDGLDSHAGCGANSRYRVSWQYQRV